MARRRCGGALSRPNWFPPLKPATEADDAQAILDCQGMWWTFGSPICRKPEQCVAEMVCYFVVQAAKHPMFRDHIIHWSRGFDPEPRSLTLFGAGARS